MCPSKIEYSKKQQDEAAAELQEYKGKIPAVEKLVGDYSKTRRAIQVCAE